MLNSSILIWYKGEKVKAEAHTFSRYGKDSPSSLYFRYASRWISPLEQRIKGHDLVDKTLKGIFTLHYGSPALWASLVLKENPFLKMIPKEQSTFGAYIPVPIRYGEINE